MTISTKTVHFSFILLLAALFSPGLAKAQLQVLLQATPPACGGFPTGSVTALPSNGVPPFTYLWNTGDTTQTINLVPAGTYSVTVTDDIMQVAFASVILTEPVPVTATLVVNSCVAPGTITANPAGGTGTYTYNWSTGQTTPTITYTMPGDYCVTILDGNLCGVIECAKEVGTPPEVDVVANNVLCFGDANGSLQATVTGGAAPFTFLWSNGDTTAIITDLAPGVYFVTVTDANMCTDSDFGTVEEPDPLLVNINGQDPTCVGETDGSAMAIASGGTPPYSYLWNTGAVTPSISNLGPGTYSVTVTDDNNCSAEATITLEYQSQIQVVATATDITCFGENDGTASAVASNGVPPYNYQWSNGQSGANLTNLPAGIYTVTATDAVGCTATDQVTVEEAPLFTASVTTTDATMCGAADGSATAVPVGGVPPYTYLWSNGSMQPSISGLPAGTYSVTVADASGCEVTATGIVGQPPTISVTITGTDETCEDANDGSATANPMGTPPYTYIWSNGQMTQTINNLVPGVYSVTVSDASGCSGSASVTIDPAPDFTLDFTVTEILCFGESTGAIALNASGGVPPYTYLWNTGAMTSSLSNLPAGNYSVTITDDSDCEFLASFTLGQPPALVVDAAGSNVSCDQSTGGTVTTTVSGGTSPYTYLWNTGATTPGLSGVGPGTYTVTVTDDNGCEETASATVTSLDNFMVTGFAVEVLCFGDANGSITVTAFNGVPPYTFNWSNGDTGDFIDGLAAGDYTVTASDASGCTVVETFTVEEPEELTGVIVTTGGVCLPGLVTATAQPSGGTPPYDYLWNTGATTQSISNLGPGTYSVVIRDVHLCETSASVTILPVPNIDVDLSATELLCFDDQTAVVTSTVNGGQAPYTYLWNTGAMTPDLNGVGAGLYSLTVTDANGCSGSASINVLAPPAINIALTADDVNCFGANDGSITSTVNGGTPPYDYEWSNGALTADISNLAPGVYTLTVTDDNGCTETASATIEQPEDLDVSITVLAEPCPGDAIGSLQATATGGTSPYTYSWSNGGSGPVQNDLPAGTYTVTATDVQGCMAAVNIELLSIDGPSCSIDVVQPISVPGGSDGILLAVVSGGTGPYSYLWSTGAVTASVSGLSEGIYSVTITDANGCTTSCSEALGDPPAVCVGDFVWEDLDQDGIQDQNFTGPNGERLMEPGVPNVKVILSGNDAMGNPLNLVQFTDANGEYLFDPIPPGTYKLTFELPQDYHFTLQNAGANDELDSDVDTITGMTEFFTLVTGADCDLSWDAGVYVFCINVDDPGVIAGDEYLCGPGNDPSPIVEIVPATGGVGALEYLWMYSLVGGPFNQTNWFAIPNTNSPNYDPGPIYQTTYFIRCVRRDNCILYLESNPIVKTVGTEAVASITGPDIICVDEVASYTAQSNGPGATYLWNFGNNATPPTANTQNATVVWSTFGLRTVSLQVTQNGCTSTDLYDVFVTNSPVYCQTLAMTIQAELFNNAEVLLSWVVPDLGSPHTFQIERSKTGQEFEVLGVQAYTQGEPAYAFTDEQPMPGRNLYRVRVSDDAGHYQYSETVEVLLFEGNTEFMLYPNPASNFIVLEMVEETPEGAYLELFNIAGQRLWQVPLEAGQTVHQVEIASIPQGGYVWFLRMPDGTQRAVRFVKL